MLPLYATLLFPKVLRLLGAKIGKNVEVLTVMHVTPDLLQIADGSFLADACLIGGQRAHGGFVEVLPNRIGERTFIGNSAHVRGGIEIGNDSLIGDVDSACRHQLRPQFHPFAGIAQFRAARYAGQDLFRRDEHVSTFEAAHCRPIGMEVLRLLLPAFVLAASLVAFAGSLLVLGRDVAWPVALLMAAVISLGVSVGMVIVAAIIKRLLIGAYKPRLALCGALMSGRMRSSAGSQSAVSTAMTPLMGTPFMAPCLRLMGCKVGRWVFLETTLFSEFDLVEIGDHAALNMGVTVQTHLFEDQVMKADRLKISEHCSIGNMSVVLYGTEMQNEYILFRCS